MNAEEPVSAPLENLQINTPSEPLPETKQLPKVGLPMQVSLLSLMHQWQPMGIRITIGLPFVGSDSDPLFIVRNGPYIPRWDQDIRGKQRQITRYAYNNTRNVFLFPSDKKDNPVRKYPDKFKIVYTHYDYPPILATLSRCFRRWRGDMQYRIRVVSGFTTQGYVFLAPLKATTIPVGIYNEYAETPTPLLGETSYREAMTNSYVMADTSMFRHMEITYPYEYPVPYYDQYHWISQRLSPNFYNDPSLPTDTFLTAGQILDFCPDNFFFLGLRGALESTRDGAQLVFELEYRAAEGFQFADPGIPPRDLMYPYRGGIERDILDKTISIPDPTLGSNGIDSVFRVKQDGSKSFRTDNERLAYLEGRSPHDPQNPLPQLPSDFEKSADVQTTSVPVPVALGLITTQPPETAQHYAVPKHLTKHYKSCRMDTRSGKRVTYCLDFNDKWHVFQGTRPRVQHRAVDDDIEVHFENSQEIADQQAQLIASDRETRSRRRRDAEFSY